MGRKTNRGMNVNLIVATSENGVIGKDGDMPWGRSMPADLKHFQHITTLGESNVVIMGRKTYDSIGKALPGRVNYVITRNRNKEETDYIDAEVYNTIEDALAHAQGLEYFLKLEIDVHIIGGASIYNQAMEMGIVDRIHHTLIEEEFEGDTFFNVPEDWVVKSTKPYLSDDRNKYDYTFRVLKEDSDLSPSQGLNSLFG
jgi:dihydrofolate reductase